MASLETTFASLRLKSPIIVGSSGITSSVKNIITAEKKGAGAVILRSLFEEEITDHSYADQNIHPESKEYLENASTMEYLNLIKEAKQATEIPVIASVNCVSDDKWPEFTQNLEAAGADAIELNIMILPHQIEEEDHMLNINKYLPGQPKGKKSRFTSSQQVEEQIYSIVKKVKESTKLPILVKLSPHITSIYDVADRLNDLEVEGLTLFNHFISLDYDLENREWTTKMNHSSPGESAHVLRWTALLKDVIHSNISATTGIRTHEDAIKFLIAGATTVQLCSVIYEEGLDSIAKISKGLKSWMEENKYSSISELHEIETIKPKSILTRNQFLKTTRKKKF